MMANTHSDVLKTFSAVREMAFRKWAVDVSEIKLFSEGLFVEGGAVEEYLKRMKYKVVGLWSAKLGTVHQQRLCGG